jgi:hypothetical protein
MRQLVNSWIRAEKDSGNNLAAAIRRMNEKHDTKLTHSRVAEWRRGRYAPSQVMISHMLYRILPWVLTQAGIATTEQQRKALEELLWVFNEKDGRRWVELL